MPRRVGSGQLEKRQEHWTLAFIAPCWLKPKAVPKAISKQVFCLSHGKVKLAPVLGVNAFTTCLWLPHRSCPARTGSCLDHPPLPQGVAARLSILQPEHVGLLVSAPAPQLQASRRPSHCSIRLFITKGADLHVPG